MHHKLFRPKDLGLVGLILGIIALTIAAIVWNLVSSEGEPIPIAGWVSASAAVISGSAILVTFYVQRWLFVRDYDYTVKGVEYFSRGCEIYIEEDVERDIDAMIEKWLAYYRKEGIESNLALVASGAFIEGAVCIFRPETKWQHTAPSFWTRMVTGLTWGNWTMVGQGGRPIEKTAHAHELSHVHINLYAGRYVNEADSHAIFKIVGV
jgi:hypothetical protein